MCQAPGWVLPQTFMSRSATCEVVVKLHFRDEEPETELSPLPSIAAVEAAVRLEPGLALREK